MVGVINPNASVSVEVQKEYAANSSFMLLPGQDWPSEEDPFATTSTSTATAGYTTSLAPTVTPTPTANPSVGAATGTAEPSVSHKSTLSAGPIAGIAIGKLIVSDFFGGLSQNLTHTRRGSSPTCCRRTIILLWSQVQT